MLIEINGQPAASTLPTPTRTQEPARKLLESWRTFKENLFGEFKAAEEQLDLGLDGFYTEVYKLRRKDIDTKVSEIFPGEIFGGLTNANKRVVLWKLLDRLDPVYKQAFDNLGTSGDLNTQRKNILIRGLAYHIGTQSMRDLKPCLKVETEVDDYFRKRIREDFTPPAGIKFLSSGSSGTVFLVEDREKPYVLKLSNQRETNDPKRPYRIAFERAGVENSNGVLGQERKDLQRLAKANTGEDLGIIDETTGDGVLATEYFSGGITLDASVKAEDLETFVNADGLNINSLVSFIQTIFTLAKGGADLSAMVHPNLLYRAETKSLALVDYVGLDNDHYQKIRNFIKDKPLLFTLYKLISDIVLMQSATADNLRTKIASAGSNLEQFMQNRFKLLIQVLKEIFANNIEGFSKDEAKEELTNLENNPELKALFGPKLGLSDDGLKYARELAASLDS